MDAQTGAGREGRADMGGETRGHDEGPRFANESEVWESVQWRALTGQFKCLRNRERPFVTYFEDARHPLSPTSTRIDGVLYPIEALGELALTFPDSAREPVNLLEAEMNGIAGRLQTALETIKDARGLKTQRELADYLEVGVNEPRNWIRHPERVTARVAALVCEKSGTHIEDIQTNERTRKLAEESLLGAEGIEERRRGVECLHADELAYLYGRLHQWQRETLTAIVWEMCQANAYREAEATP